MQDGKQECLVHSDDEFSATLAQLEKKKSPPKQSKKIDSKAEIKEVTKSPKNETKSEKKEDAKPQQNRKAAQETKSSAKKSIEV